jgi:hypothetical protein
MDLTGHWRGGLGFNNVRVPFVFLSSELLEIEEDHNGSEVSIEQTNLARNHL